MPQENSTPLGSVVVNTVKRSLLIATLFIATRKDAFAQTGKSDFNSLVSHIESVRKNRPVENIYIHFDKPYYAAGDTIYFKTYVTLNELHRSCM